MEGMRGLPLAPLISRGRSPWSAEYPRTPQTLVRGVTPYRPPGCMGIDLRADATSQNVITHFPVPRRTRKISEDEGTPHSEQHRQAASLTRQRELKGWLWSALLSRMRLRTLVAHQNSAEGPVGSTQGRAGGRNRSDTQGQHQHADCVRLTAIHWSLPLCYSPRPSSVHSQRPHRTRQERAATTSLASPPKGKCRPAISNVR